MSLASTILASYKTKLAGLHVSNGGGIRFLDLFGGDWDAFFTRKDTLAPGILIHYRASRPKVLDNSRSAHARILSINTYLFNDCKKGITERVSGWNGTPGIWEMEDAVYPVLLGAQLDVEGCAGVLTKPLRVTGSSEASVSDIFTVWQIQTEVETPVVL